MNQTKKITQGAMMLAIIGALILIDRMTAYWFTEIIVLMMPVVIVIYSAMHTLRDGVMLSVGLIILSFLLGNFQFTYLIYVPVGIVTGLVYAFGVRRKLDKQTLLLMSMATYIIGEIIATFIVYPLLGFPIATLIAEYKIAMKEAGSFMGMDYSTIFEAAGINFDKVIVIVYILSTILMGAMEGVLIHLLSVFLLKKFKIVDLGNISIWDIKPNKTLAYVCMLFTFAMYLTPMTENQVVYYTLISLSIMAAMVLLYYGYLFVILYGVIVLHRNVGAFFVLLAFLIPALLVVLLILGFLYGAGPLRTYLENRRQVKL